VSLVVHEPIETSALARDSVRDLAERVRTTVAAG